MNQITEDKKDDITALGNPRKPQNEEGKEMLERMNESHALVTAWALDFFKYQNNDSVLDIGCGGGGTLSRISKKIPNGKLTGVDYSKVSVNLSTEWNKSDIQTGKMKIIEASVEELPFEENHFDKIITVESFYFWPNPTENLREVRRVLKEGGHFLLVADIYDNLKLTEKDKENIKRYQMLNPSIDEYKAMFQNAGFRQIIIHTKENENWICVEGIK